MLASFLAAATLGGVAAPGAVAAPRPDDPVPPALAASLALRSVRPIAPQPGDTVTFTGTLTNESALPLQDLSLQFYVGPDHVGTRGEFDAFADEAPTDDFSVDGLQQRTDATLTLPHDSLAIGGREPWRISVPIAALDLQPWEVYRVGMEVVSDGQPVTRLRTFLPYAPVGAQYGRRPLSISWLWPLVDRPHQNVVGTSVLFTDDTLAPQLQGNGRLAQLLAAATTAARQHPRRGQRRHGKHRAAPDASDTPPRQPVPVTLAVDPMLLSQLAHMSTGYNVHSGARTRPGTGRSAAAAYLSQLKSLLDGGPPDESVLPLPYADPDLVAAVRAHRTDQLATAFSLATTTVARVLSLQSGDTRLLSQWVWPPDGYADRATVDWLFGQQTQTLVLDSGGYPVTGEQPGLTANAHVEVPSRDGTINGVLTDTTLSHVIADGAVTDSGAALQRYLAETLMIEAQAPSTPGRSIAVAAPRRWSPPAGYARQLLQDTGRVPWLQPTPIATAAQAAITTGLDRELRYPHSEALAELPGHSLHTVARLTHEVNQLGAILQPGAGTVRADDLALLQALSSAWRSAPALAADYRNLLSAQIDQTMSHVRIATARGSLITLTSHSGTVPITIFNGLDQPVRVGIRLNTAHRLSISGGEQVHQIPAHQRVAVDVRATANVSGEFPVSARLVTPGHHPRPFGDQEVLLYVRSTAYGTAALAITAGALAVLLLAVGYRLVRRALAARRSATA